MTVRTSTYGLILGIIATCLSDVAGACTCERVGTRQSQIEASYEGASAVFAARVVRVTEHWTWDGRQAIAELHILEVWKGNLSMGDVVEAGVLPSKGGISCQYSTQEGEELLVYASGSPPYQLTVCSLTGPLSSSQSDRELLDELRKKHHESAK